MANATEPCRADAAMQSDVRLPVSKSLTVAWNGWDDGGVEQGRTKDGRLPPLSSSSSSALPRTSLGYSAQKLDNLVLADAFFSAGTCLPKYSDKFFSFFALFSFVLLGLFCKLRIFFFAAFQLAMGLAVYFLIKNEMERNGELRKTFELYILEKCLSVDYNRFELVWGNTVGWLGICAIHLGSKQEFIYEHFDMKCIERRAFRLE